MCTHRKTARFPAVQKVARKDLLRNNLVIQHPQHFTLKLDRETLVRRELDEEDLGPLGSGPVREEGLEHRQGVLSALGRGGRTQDEAKRKHIKG